MHILIILKVIFLILSCGIRAAEAVKEIAENSGEDEEKIWEKLPEQYK